jgi:hypothetical protein
MADIKEMLEDEIVEVFNAMKGQSPDTDKYKKTLDGLTRLYELKISEERMEQDFQDKEARREMEERHHIDEVDAAFSTRKDEIEEKEKQHKFQILSLAIGTGATLLTAGCSLIFHNYWLKKSFKFEEDGTITGAASRGVWNPLFKIFRK